MITHEIAPGGGREGTWFPTKRLLHDCPSDGLFWGAKFSLRLNLPRGRREFSASGSGIASAAASASSWTTCRRAAAVQRSRRRRRAHRTRWRRWAGRPWVAAGRPRPTATSKGGREESQSWPLYRRWIGKFGYFHLKTTAKVKRSKFRDWSQSFVNKNSKYWEWGQKFCDSRQKEPWRTSVFTMSESRNFNFSLEIVFYSLMNTFPW